MSRGTQQEAAFLAAYAREAGVALRTARAHRAKNHPSWAQWCEHHGLRSSSAAGSADEMSELDRATRAEQVAWELLSRLQSAALRADPLALAALTHAIREARHTWQDSAAARRLAAQEARTLIPLHAIRTIQRDHIPALADTLRILRNNIAGHLPPDQRAEMPGWDRAIRQLDAAIERLLAPA